jgi:hypothetical protein
MDGWFFVNILGPLLLPVVGILPLRLLPLDATPAGLRLMTPVKDGQLCWAAIAMAISSIYEVWKALVAHRTLPPWAGVVLAVTIVVMLQAMVIAAGGAAFNTGFIAQAGGGLRAWVSHYRVFVASAIMTAYIAAVDTSLHTALAP